MIGHGARCEPGRCRECRKAVRRGRNDCDVPGRIVHPFTGRLGLTANCLPNPGDIQSNPIREITIARMVALPIV